MNEQLIKHIEDLGLSNKEALVYVACLMLGGAPAQRIAEQAGIKRVTTYVILESLISLGLVSQSIKGKKTYFNAEDPTNLRRLLEKREQELKDQKASFEQLMPELLTLKSLPTESPSVKFYDSPEGIRSIMDTFYSEHNDLKEAFGVSNMDQIYDFFPDIKQQASNPRRQAAGIASQLLYTLKEGPVLKTGDKTRNRESRWVPADKFPFVGDFSVIGRHIVLLSLSGPTPIGITIDSSELAQGLHAVFDLAWEAAQSYNK